MGSWHGQVRPASAMLCVLAVAGGLSWSNGAEAFQLKHTSQGKPLGWTQQRVSYVVDPSVEAHVPGGSKAFSSASAGWSGSAGGLVLSASAGPGGAEPGVDGQNSVIFAPHGFAPAGEALAVTVTSYDDSTGEIVDADIVINGIHAFAVLASGAQPGPNVSALSTDGSDDDDVSASAVFDIVHVMSHEVGHSLGLADERDDADALMYAFTRPGDASERVPSSDDVDGVDAIYGAAGASPLDATRAGCAQASVAGSRSRPSDAWAAFAIVGGAGLWLAARRRAKAPRFALAIGSAVTALVAGALPAHSAPVADVLLGDASARVVAVSTTSVGGLFETTLDLEPTACRIAACPGHATAHAWGGTVGGITQQIGGGAPVPVLGDVVAVTFTGSPGASGVARTPELVAPMAVLVAPHR